MEHAIHKAAKASAVRKMAARDEPQEFAEFVEEFRKERSK